jgi:hypothetical protein
MCSQATHHHNEKKQISIYHLLLVTKFGIIVWNLKESKFHRLIATNKRIIVKFGPFKNLTYTHIYITFEL